MNRLSLLELVEFNTNPGSTNGSDFKEEGASHWVQIHVLCSICTISYMLVQGDGHSLVL